IQADLNALTGVSRRHLEAARRLRDQAHDHIAVEMDALASYVGAGLTPLAQSGFVPEVNADLAKDRERGLMYAFQLFDIHDFDRPDAVSQRGQTRPRFSRPRANNR